MSVKLTALIFMLLPFTVSAAPVITEQHHANYLIPNGNDGFLRMEDFTYNDDGEMMFCQSMKGTFAKSEENGCQIYKKECTKGFIDGCALKPAGIVPRVNAQGVLDARFGAGKLTVTNITPSDYRGVAIIFYINNKTRTPVALKD